VNKGDERTALAVLRDLAELQGLYSAARTLIGGHPAAPPVAVEHMVGGSDAERLERVRHLINIARQRQLPYSGTKHDGRGDDDTGENNGKP
jgi:hypothetical protein